MESARSPSNLLLHPISALNRSLFMDFDPFTEPRSITRLMAIGPELKKAQVTVKHRSREQLDLIVDVIRSLPQMPGYAEDHLRVFSGDPTADISPLFIRTGTMWPGSGELDTLIRNADRIALPCWAGLPGLEWPELFATFALLNIAHAEHALKEAMSVQLCSTEYSLWHSSACSLDDTARKAILWLEQQERREKRHEQKTKALGQAGASAKHANSNALKTQILRIYDEKYRNAGLKNLHAAKIILKELEDSEAIRFEGNGLRLIFDGKEVLSSENHPACIQKWIGLHLKQSPM